MTGVMYKLNGIVDRIKMLREAADVQRIHTKRTIGEYSNGHHTFGMLALLRLLWPEAPKELIWAIIEHDLPERLISDISSPAINYGKFVDKAKLAEAEESILAEIFDFHFFPALEGMDLLAYRWLKGLDLLDLYLFCKDQRRLGNKNILQVEHRCTEVFKFRAKDFPKEVLDAFWSCFNDTEWSDLPDLGVVR